MGVDPLADKHEKTVGVTDSVRGLCIITAYRDTGQVRAVVTLDDLERIHRFISCSLMTCLFISLRMVNRRCIPCTQITLTYQGDRHGKVVHTACTLIFTMALGVQGSRR